MIGVNPGEYYSWGFCNLVVNSGMRIGPIALGSKTSSPGR